MRTDDRPCVVHIVHALQGGGTERTLVALLRAFDPARFQHVVVTLRRAGALSAKLPDHVACRPLGVQGRSWSTGFELARITRQHQASTIHARNTSCWADATVAAVLTPGARLVLGFHGLESSPTLGRRHARLARFGLLAGARFVSVSRAGLRQLRDEASVPAHRIHVLPNGVDLRRFGGHTDVQRRKLRSTFGFDERSFIVGAVGSLTPIKRHSALIEAVATAVRSMPTIALLIVGDGPLRHQLAAQARTLGIFDRVRFTGWREDVPELMSCMDTFVCSSESEGMSNALLEAMATGLPIIATDVGDNGIMVRRGLEGIIVEPGCATAIGKAIRTLACDPDRRRRFAAACANRARQYGFDATVCAYEAFYQTLTTARSASSPPSLIEASAGTLA